MVVGCAGAGRWRDGVAGGAGRRRRGGVVGWHMAGRRHCDGQLTGRGAAAVASRMWGAEMGTGLCGARVRRDCGAMVAPRRVRVGGEPASDSGGLGLCQHST
uniref:Uncharacterized protein n=1 Tax=Oryza rufipogon TaxID=4529 RepID=A0A0E0QIR9_ORYRU